MICWHKWSPWSEPSEVKVWRDGITFHQSRACEKCNKAQLRSIFSKTRD